MFTAVWVAIICLAVIVLLLAAASAYFYNVGIKRSTKEFLEADPALVKEEHPWELEEEWLHSQPVETLELTSSDGIALKGYFIPAATPARQTAIVVHGYSSQGREMGAFAKLYHEMGMNVLMPDNRGHGQSGGNYIGFGWPDRRDIMRWIGTVIDRSGPGAEIILHGVSMGGATVLMVSGEELPGQVKCIVSDCAYTSVRDILTHQLKQMYKLPPFPLLPATSLMCKLRAGYSFGEASALKQVARTKLPILFIHGDRDTFVPYAMLHRLVDAAAGDKEVYVVQGASHANAYFVDKKEYERRIRQFIGRYIRLGEGTEKEMIPEPEPQAVLTPVEG